MSFPVSPPVCSTSDSSQKPENQVGQVDPDGILHSGDAGISFRVLVDVHLAENAKNRTPEDKDDQAPGWNHGKAQNKWDQVEECSQGGKRTDEDGVDLEGQSVHDSRCIDDSNLSIHHG